MTATFWAIVSAMTLAVLALVLRPLLMRQSTVTNEQEKKLPVYRQQFSELEQDLTNQQFVRMIVDVHAPAQCPAARIQRCHQAAVGAEIDHAIQERQAAIHATAHIGPPTHRAVARI